MSSGGGYRTVRNNQIELLSREDSLKMVLQNCKRDEYRGFIRFGDGEYQLMKGVGISFQRADSRLSCDLKNALHNQAHLDIDIAVDIPSYIEIKGMKVYRRPIYWPWSLFYVTNCTSGKKYLYTGFTMPYLAAKRKGDYDQNLLNDYYGKFKNLFYAQRVVLFAGEGILSKLEHLPFDECKEFYIEKCPSSDSYFRIDEIIERAEIYSRNFWLCFVIGPCSKVVSYRLMEKGYRCFDLGHFLKDYDMFMNNKDLCENDYFSPDK